MNRSIPVRSLALLATAGSLALGWGGTAHAQVSISPSCQPATIGGIARDGQTLTARRGSCEAPSPAVTLQWFVCDAQGQSCTARTGQTRSSSLSYVVKPADVNGRLVAQQVATNSFGTDLDNTLTSIVAAVPPSATPVISGPARVGEQLSGSEGFLSGTQPSVAGYQWLRCEADGAACVAIPGATTKAYVLANEDAGKTIRFQVTVTGPQHTVDVQSAQTQVVQGGTPVGGGPEPEPPGSPAPNRPARPTPLRPFPTVVIAGRVFSSRAVVSILRVRGPRGARVTVTCRGQDCPVRRQRRRIRRGSVRLRAFETGLIAGTVIEIRVTGANRIGKFTRLRILRDRTPARIDLCVRPGRRRPVSCPGGVG